MAMSFSEWKKKREENGQGTSRPSAASTTSHSPSTATSGGSSGSRSFSEWKSDRDAKKPTSAIEDWWKSSEALVSEVQLYYNSWKSDEDKFNAFQEKASNLLSIADGLRKQYS